MLLLYDVDDGYSLLVMHIEDGTTDLAIIDVAMYNAYQKEYNYDVVANQISDEDAKAIADNSYTGECTGNTDR